MKMKATKHIVLSIMLAVVAVAVLGVGTVLAQSPIDDNNKYAWSTNAGWINFNDANGGVTVYEDHLEGYAWGENIGWISMGAPSASIPYVNDAADNYGVNIDGVGNCSGYAWGTNIGWINFDPSDGGVWIDPVSGDFDGYAWSENIGWIRFQNSGPDYKVSAPGWHAGMDPAYFSDISAIITTHRPGTASSSGLDIANTSFLSQSGDGIIIGHNGQSFACVSTNVTGTVKERWSRIWQMDVNDEGSNGEQVTLTFDVSDAGGDGDVGANLTYSLLKRPTGGTGDFAEVTLAGTPIISGDQVTFLVNVSDLGSEFTLGSNGNMLNPVPGAATIILIVLGVVAIGGFVWYRRRKVAIIVA